MPWSVKINQDCITCENLKKPCHVMALGYSALSQLLNAVDTFPGGGCSTGVVNIDCNAYASVLPPVETPKTLAEPVADVPITPAPVETTVQNHSDPEYQIMAEDWRGIHLKDVDGNVFVVSSEELAKYRIVNPAQ